MHLLPDFCQLMRIRFVKKTKHITNEEISYVKNQIENLNKTEILKASSGELQIKHTLAFTMIDARVCNDNNTSTYESNRPKILTTLVKKTENPDALKFDLSVLHALIRFFESLLHEVASATTRR